MGFSPLFTFIMEVMIKKMDRQSLYEIYQENLKLLENELKQVKKMTQINLGKLQYEKENRNILGKIEKLEYDVLGGTRLYTFLLCSWLEARLKKILYENSSAAFTDDERSDVLAVKQMDEKWRICLNLAVCKSYGFTFDKTQVTYESYFANDNIEALQCYQKVFSYMDDIKQAITVRNRLAHGQWKTQLNSAETNLAGAEVSDFFATNNNIQILDLLYKVYGIMAEIISSYVVYKDKILTKNFNNDLKHKIEKIDNYRKRIEKNNFDAYCNPFYRKECQERERRRNSYKVEL